MHQVVLQKPVYPNTTNYCEKVLHLKALIGIQSTSKHTTSSSLQRTSKCFVRKHKSDVMFIDYLFKEKGFLSVTQLSTAK